MLTELSTVKHRLSIPDTDTTNDTLPPTHSVAFAPLVRLDNGSTSLFNTNCSQGL
jgi:hypothetical protein